MPSQHRKKGQDSESSSSESDPKPRRPSNSMSSPDDKDKKSPFSFRHLLQSKSTSHRPSGQTSASHTRPPRRSSSHRAAESSSSHQHKKPSRRRSSLPPNRDTTSASHRPSSREIFSDITQDGLSTPKRHAAVHGHKSRPVQAQGTRGLHVPAYSSPRHFSQVDRARNPRVRIQLPLHFQDRFERGKVVVRLYHCETLVLSRGFLRSPHTSNLVSAASAFLGECKLRDSPPDAETHRRNQGYVGLDLQSAHGGFHLHYPDCAGPVPFDDESIAEDWDQVMQAHRHSAHHDVLLVGVGLGEAGQCCARGSIRQH
ncbi:hypothetical protein F4677DRAFT_271629 [Hypoxylon crocopeplum]|nr:hypothetical protein F4677DRAFT_271629 [Hypoxylon crocopeplum]